MSRPNSSKAQFPFPPQPLPGGHEPFPPQGARQVAPGFGAAAPQQAYAQQQPLPQQPYAQPGYGGQNDPYAALAQPPAYQPAPSQAQHQRAPSPPFGHQFDPYAREPAPAQSYAPFPGEQRPQAAAGHGYDQWPAPAAAPAYGQPQRGQELSSYTPAAGAGQHHAAPQHFQPAHQHHHAGAMAQQPFEPAFEINPQAPANEWGMHDPYAAQQPIDPGYDPAAYATQPAGFEQTYAEDDAGYDSPAPRRGRTIALVLASAVALGGGLAWGYSALVAPSPNGAPPMVKSAEGPFKVKPSDPGGRKFDHADRKLMDRLGEGGAATDETGARRVPILTVSRDGTIMAPPPAAESASEPQHAHAPVTTGAVPGVAFTGTQPARETAPTPPVEPVVATAPAPTPKKPIVITKAAAASPPSQAPEARRTAALDAEPGETPRPAPKKPAVPASGLGHKPTGAGYVAVLSSAPASASSQATAIAHYADLNAKYSALLASKTPEVMVTDLGEKGTYARLVAGPPGSLEQVKALCSGLKEAGHNNCWPLPY